MEKKNVYDKLHPSGSAHAHIYGIPKMHKSSSSDTFPKLWPVVSFIATFNYNPACFFCDLPLPLGPDDYPSKDTFTFVSQIYKANLSNKFLVFYDVTGGLFINIPLQKTIHIVINLIFKHNLNLKITKKNLENFSFLLYHILIFFLTVSFIIKIYAGSMGSLLPPALANIFMFLYALNG